MKNIKRNKFIAAVVVTLVGRLAAFSKITTSTMIELGGFKIPAGEGKIHRQIKLK